MVRPKCCQCSEPASVNLNDNPYCGNHAWEKTQAEKRQGKKVPA
jgi:hypothetical protein